MTDADLDRTVERLLVSRTFDAEELPDVLAARGHERAAVVETIGRVQASLALVKESPAAIEAKKSRRLGGRLLRAGVLWLAAGLIFSVIQGVSLVTMAIVLGGGTMLIFAGNRAMRAGDVVVGRPTRS